MPTPDTNQQLADALKQAKRGPMRFAFVVKGPAEGTLLVARKSIPAKEIAEAKKELGGGKVYRGRCAGEMGALVCEVAQEPPATLAKQLKGIITRDAGPLFKAVEFRVVADLAEEEQGEAPPEGVPPPPSPPLAADKAAVLKRLSALIGPYQAAVAAQDTDLPRMQSLMVAVKGLVGNQDFAQAGKVLDELEPLVAQGRAVRPGTPPVGDGAAPFTARLKALLPQIQQAQAGATPATQEIKLRVSEANTFARKKDFAQANAQLDAIEPLLKPDVGSGGAEWKKNLAAWTPAIKAALTAKGPNAAVIAKLFTQAGALSKPGGDMAQAMAKLTECHALATASAANRTEPVAPKSEEPTPADDALEAQFYARFTEVDSAYQAILQTQPANASDLRASMAYANAAAEKNDYAAALAALKRLEEQLEAAKTLGRETDVIPEGIVKQRVEELEKASNRWREVHFQSIEGLGSLMKKLRADEDPELHEIANRVDVLTKDIPAEIENSLKKLSAAVRSGDAGAVANGVKQVQQDVEKCETYLKENLSYLENCEENPFDDVPVLIQKPVRETLTSIRASLAGLSA
jgi:hypothetical protein